MSPSWPARPATVLAAPPICVLSSRSNVHYFDGHFAAEWQPRLRLRGSGIPAAFLSTTYTSHYTPFFEPSVSITALRLNSPGFNTMPGASLQALSVTSSDRVVLGNILEVRLGSELQTIQFMGRVNAFKPFGSADLHISPNTVLEYQYASSVPDSRLEDRSGGPATASTPLPPTRMRPALA